MTVAGKYSSLPSPPRPGYTAGAVSAAAGIGQPQNKFTVTLVTVYLFLIISRVLDLSPLWWMHIPLIMLVVLIGATIARGDLRFAFSSKVTRVFACFTAWVVICYPLSSWRAISTDAVRLALESFVVYLIIVQFVRTEPNWRRMAGAYAWAALVAAVYGFVFGRYSQGRLQLIGGTFADPNEFAMTLLVGLPFWWMKASRATLFRKVFCLACTVPIFITVARTGSRAGLLAIMTITCLMFLTAKAPQKLMIAVVTIVGLACAVAFLPEYLKVRYMTIFAPDDAASIDPSARQRLQGDIASSEGRQELLRESISLTFEHPIFGVGPGDFAFAAWDERKGTMGVGGLAQVSHNTYTQISSETGIPGFLFFIGTVFLSLKSTVAIRRRGQQVGSELAIDAKYFLIASTGLAVGIFFLSVGYTHVLAVFFALAAALQKMAEAVPALRDAAGAKATETPRLAPQPAALAGGIATPVRRRTPSYLRRKQPGGEQSGVSQQ